MLIGLTLQAAGKGNHGKKMAMEHTAITAIFPAQDAPEVTIVMTNWKNDEGKLVYYIVKESVEEIVGIINSKLN